MTTDHTFTVWAPSATTVEVHALDRAWPLSRRQDGWWSARVPGAGHGTDYAFSVDGGPPTPDPRSPWQPRGVHAASRVFDAGRHTWGDRDWQGRDVLGAVLYELHAGTFTPEGTLDAAVPRLSHLAEVGVDVVSLMPVAAFPGTRGWGYDGVHPYAVHEPYGGPAALQRFVDAAHGAGLAVCLDVVYNHLGPSGNYLSRFAPYFTDRHHTPWGQGVNLDDEGSEEVRRWICDNALRWFRDFHIDALRLDAVHAMADDTPMHVLAQLSTETTSLAADLGRPLGLVAESDLNDATMVTPVAESGLGMTAQWDDDVHHALHALLTGERQGYYADFGSTEVVATVLTQAFWHAGRHSTFRGRTWGQRVDPAAVSGHRFLAYLQTHDQVGNRATGERLAALVTIGQLASGAALVMTSAFTPMLFMGEEWGASTPWQYFTDFSEGSEPGLGQAVSDGRRQEFASHGWAAADVPDPQDPATRDASVLDWAELGRGDHARLLAWHRDLIALRRSTPDLRDPRLDHVRVDHDAEAGWLVVHRGEHRVVVNLRDEPATVPVAGDVVLAFDQAQAGPDGVRLGGHGVAVVG